MSEGAYRDAPDVSLAHCPHCQTRAPSREHPVLRWVCKACGGPVIPALSAPRLPPDVENDLWLARVALAQGWAQSTAVLIALVWSFELFLLVGHAFAGFNRTALALGVPALATLAYLLHRARRVDNARRASEPAWLRALALTAESKNNHLTARQASQILRIRVADAERLLARLSESRGSIDIDDDQQVHYRVNAPDPLLSEATPAPPDERASRE